MWLDYFSIEMDREIAELMRDMDRALWGIPTIGALWLTPGDLAAMTVEELESAYVGEVYP